MSNIKLNLATQLLRTFSKREQKEFLNILNDGTKKGQKLHQLAKHLFKPRSKSKTQDLSNLISPEASINHQKIIQLLSDLNSAGQEFLSSRSNYPLKSILLAHELNERKLTQHRDRFINKFYLNTDKQTMSYREQYEWEQLIFEVRYQEQREVKHNLALIEELLELDFFLAKLRQACSLKSRETFGKDTFDYSLLESLLPKIKNLDFYKHPDIAAFYYAYHFISKPEDQESWDKLQKILVDNGSQISRKNAKDLYLLAINYCIRRVNQGIAGMAQRALDLYRQGIESGVLLDGGHLSSFAYRNAVALGIHLRKYKWVQTFIHEQANRLKADEREDMRHYNLAKLAYAQNELDEALLKLRFIDTKDSLFTLSMYTLRAKIYYQNKDYDLLSAHLDKMDIYLRRKTTSYHQNNHRKFIAYCRKLLHLFPGDKSASELLVKSLRQETDLIEKEWLVKMAN